MSKNCLSLKLNKYLKCGDNSKEKNLALKSWKQVMNGGRVADRFHYEPFGFGFDFKNNVHTFIKSFFFSLSLSWTGGINYKQR